jgi:HSP20 family molecular chaperone IbpA
VDQGQRRDAFLWNGLAGTVTRQLQLGAEIDEAKADAGYRDGVLQLTLPKTESAQVKRISIH